MLSIKDYIDGFEEQFKALQSYLPWQITAQIKDLLFSLISNPPAGYTIKNDRAVHPTSIIEEGAMIKGPAWISEGCFIGSNAYIRDGVFLGKNVSIGPGCEIKSSILMNNTRVAHFNFIGDSIIGNDVNFEAGALVANHYNERKDRFIKVLDGLFTVDTHIQKFGALIGDHSRIGANAVLSPGTLLPVNSIVKRLELIEQNPL